MCWLKFRYNNIYKLNLSGSKHDIALISQLKYNVCSTNIMLRPKVNFEKMIIIVKIWRVIMKYLPYLEVVDLKIFTRDINTEPHSTQKACRALCSLRHKYLLIGNELLMKELPSNNQSVSCFNLFLPNFWCFVSFPSINSIQDFLRVNWAWLIFFLRMKETVFLIKNDVDLPVTTNFTYYFSDSSPRLQM